MSTHERRLAQRLCVCGHALSRHIDFCSTGCADCQCAEFTPTRQPKTTRRTAPGSTEVRFRDLIAKWRRIAPNYENGLLLEMCAFELEALLNEEVC